MSRNIALSLVLILATSLGALACSDGPSAPGQQSISSDQIARPSHAGYEELTPSQLKGQQIFRFDDFGSWRFWGDTAQLDVLIETAVSPNFALGTLGLKVDGTIVTPELLASLPDGALEDPATTVTLLGLDAVIGLKATVEDGEIERIGITCALCHSQVDNSVAPGIGKRLDGWANRDLNVGLILASLPGLPAIAEDIGVDEAALRADLLSWGRGFYDARVNVDGRLDAPEPVIPPAYGLRGVGLETFTGEGPVSYWNQYVAVTQMHGHGSFRDPQLGLHVRVRPQEDEVKKKLAPLRQYQFALETPPPPEGFFDPEAAERGREVFEGDGTCASCHVGPFLTDHGRLHDPEETGMEPTWAERGTTRGYRTTPLRGLWQHPPYFHDGSAETLADVVTHYEDVLGLDLTDRQRNDLVEYLKSL